MHSTALLLHIKREEGRTLFILYEDRIHWKDKIRNNLKNVYPYHIFPSSRRSLPRRCFPRRDLFFFIFRFFFWARQPHIRQFYGSSSIMQKDVKSELSTR